MIKSTEAISDKNLYQSLSKLGRRRAQLHLLIEKPDGSLSNLPQLLPMREFDSQQGISLVGLGRQWTTTLNKCSSYITRYSSILSSAG